jgi:hypothetical protein
MWSECTFSKWHSRKTNQGLARAIQEAASTCQGQMARWPAAVTTNMWPYALRNTQHMRKYFPDSKDGTCPSERFSGVELAPNLKSSHTFGCPVYALNSKLASGKSIPKWDARARVGLYMVPSPRHARNVSLALSLDTGLVSPQFHVQHEDFFEQCPQKLGTLLFCLTGRSCQA